MYRHVTAITVRESNIVHTYPERFDQESDEELWGTRHRGIPTIPQVRPLQHGSAQKCLARTLERLVAHLSRERLPLLSRLNHRKRRLGRKRKPLPLIVPLYPGTGQREL